MDNNLTRRRFLAAACAGTASAGLAGQPASARPAASPSARLAAMGGSPVRTQPFPSWPVIAENDEKAWGEVLRSKKWNRLGGNRVENFEKSWATRLGAAHCVATANGTSALFTSLNALEIGPGDEVLVPPYTFVATINVVLLQHALPVFVDSDRESLQIDARKIESAITKRTRCIIPVHVGGSVANLDLILQVAKNRQLPVVEDACQAHLAEWRQRKAGTLGTLGCFSFQASKNLNSGEGGAIVTDDPKLFEICMSFQNQGRGENAFVRNGDNRRLTEFQGALLLEQLTRLEEQSRVREQNAAYLTAQFREIPGILPAKMYDGCTRNAYHLYMFRYDKQHFAGLPKARFIQALQAEGIPCSGGYTPMAEQPFLKQTLNSRGFRHIYSAKEIAALEERNRCPENDKLCEEAIWFTQKMLLGTKQDMDQIAEAVRKVQGEAALFQRS
jgi:perosamine synthetase